METAEAPAADNSAPHAAQKRDPSEFSELHFAHFIATSPYLEQFELIS
jgi:hypothetical protein